MSYSNTILNQMLTLLPKDNFNELVNYYDGDKGIRKLTTWNHLVLMIYAQASGKKSLRDIETGLKVHPGVWHHLGVKTVAKSSLADANSKRHHLIFEKLFYALFAKCQELTVEKDFDFENELYSFDSSTISLCLSVFDWAKYRTTKGALKLHTLLNNRTAIPEFLTITEGSVSDIKAIKKLDIDKLENGSILVFDRAYIDYEWWREIDEKGKFFVYRVKKNQSIFKTGQHKKVIEKGILSDDIVIIGDYNSNLKKKKYTKKLRRVRFYDEETKKEYTYLTNNFELKASQIADIYKNRWQIELFFKWIKQNLKIKTFLGTSKNAVMTQIWVAMIYYLLLSYIKFQTKFKKSLLELTRMVKETLLFRRSIIDLLSLEEKNIFKIKKKKSPQLSFW